MSNRTSAGAEKSMDDILASIRRIVKEETGEGRLALTEPLPPEEPARNGGAAAAVEAMVSQPDILVLGADLRVDAPENDAPEDAAEDVAEDAAERRSEPAASDASDDAEGPGEAPIRAANVVEIALQPAARPEEEASADPAPAEADAPEDAGQEPEAAVEADLVEATDAAEVTEEASEEAEAEEAQRAAQAAAESAPAAPAPAKRSTGLLGGFDEEDDPSAPITRDEAIEVVRMLVRDELSGALGEQISRNLRKMVRREIQRALLSR